MSNKFSPNSNIGIQPSHSDFGDFAEFIIFPETLPRLYRDNNVDDFIDFVSQEDNIGKKKDHTEPEKKGIFLLKLIFGYHLFSWCMRQTFLNLPAVLRDHYYRFEIFGNSTYNDGKTRLFDFIPKFPGLIGSSVGVYVLLFGLFTISKVDSDIKGVTNLETSAAMSYFFIYTIFVFPNSPDAPKKKYSKWSKEKNNEKLDSFIVDRSDDLKTKNQSQIIQYAINYLRIKSSKKQVKFSIDSIGYPNMSQITEIDKYILSINRIKYIWGNENNKNNYTQWLDWDDEKIKSVEMEDSDYKSLLRAHIIKEAKDDLSYSLKKVMSQDNREEYLHSLLQNNEFWVESRKLKIIENNKKSEKYAKEAEPEILFMDWINEILAEKSIEPYHLIANGAMGKTTLLIQLTIYLSDKNLSKKSIDVTPSIFPLRIKLRELLMKDTHSLGLINKISLYFQERYSESNLIKENFNDILSDDNLKKLFILDGFDEITPSQQEKLLRQLEDFKFKTLISSRKNSKLRNNSAKLTPMGEFQIRRILRNVSLKADSIKEIEEIVPTPIFNQMYSLLTICELVDEKNNSLNNSDLSTYEISRNWIEKYVSRESDKKTIEKHGEIQLIDRMSESLGNLSLYYLEYNRWPSTNDLPEQDIEYLNLAKKINLLYEKSETGFELSDNWLMGYYIANIPSDREYSRIWKSVIEFIDKDSPIDKNLLIRNLISSRNFRLPHWNSLGFQSPLVMDIASQEWKATNLVGKSKLLEKLGIISNEVGMMNLNKNDLDSCEIIELISILYFHCSIADSEDWVSGEQNTDLEWEILFGCLYDRWSEWPGSLGEFKDENILLPESIYYEKYVPYNKRKFDEKSLPYPLLKFIDKKIELYYIDKQSDKLETLISVLAMISQHRTSDFNIFNLSRETLLEYIPQRYVPSESRNTVIIDASGIVGGHKCPDCSKFFWKIKEFVAHFDEGGCIDGDTIAENVEKILVNAEKKILSAVSYYEKLGYNIIVVISSATIPVDRTSNTIDYLDSRKILLRLKSPDSRRLMYGLSEFFNSWLITKTMPKEKDFPDFDIESIKSRINDKWRISNLEFTDSNLGEEIPESADNCILQTELNIALQKLIGYSSPYDVAYRYGKYLKTPKPDKMMVEFTSEQNEFILSLGLDNSILSSVPGARFLRITKTKYGDDLMTFSHNDILMYRHLSGWFYAQFIFNRFDFSPLELFSDNDLEFRFTRPDNDKFWCLAILEDRFVKDNPFIHHPMLINKSSSNIRTLKFLLNQEVPLANHKFTEIYDVFDKIENKKYMKREDFEIFEFEQKLSEIGEVIFYLNSKRFSISKPENKYLGLYIPGRLRTVGLDIKEEENFIDLYTNLKNKTGDSHLHRWYKAKFEFSEDSNGYYQITPVVKSISILCQLCVNKEFTSVEDESLKKYKKYEIPLKEDTELLLCNSCAQELKVLD